MPFTLPSWARHAGSLTLPRPGDARSRQRHAQVALGILWIVGGALQLQASMFGRPFVTGVLVPSVAGSPRFVAGPIPAAAHLLEPHLAAWNALFASVQLLIGVGLLARRTVRPALALSVVWSLAVWWLGEGLGGLFSGAASPLTGAPGAVLLSALAALLVWPRRAAAHPAPSGSAAANGVALRWGETWLLGLAVVPAVLVWAFGEAFGGIGTGTGPNTGPLLVLLALTLCPVGERRRAVDAVPTPAGVGP